MQCRTRLEKNYALMLFDTLFNKTRAPFPLCLWRTDNVMEIELLHGNDNATMTMMTKMTIMSIMAIMTTCSPLSPAFALSMSHPIQSRFNTDKNSPSFSPRFIGINRFRLSQTNERTNERKGNPPIVIGKYEIRARLDVRTDRRIDGRNSSECPP